MAIQVKLTDEQTDSLDLALSKDGVKKADYATFCQLAIDLFCDCIAGKARYRSLTELNIEVVQRIYEQMLDGECPSADRLFNGFNLPPGQAAYIARVLVEKAVPRWRKIGLVELRSRLDEQVEEKKSISPGDAKLSNVQFDITQRARHELISICTNLMKSEGNTFIMPESVSGQGDYRRVKMLVVTLRRIQKHMIDNKLGKA